MEGEAGWELRVDTITGFLNAQHAELVDVVIELLGAETEWVGPGVWTIESFLQWRCGVARSTAVRLATVARRAPDLPACLDAFRRGELTLDQMSAIARRAPGWIDEQIRDLATMMTVSQINRTLNEYPFPDLDADGREMQCETVGLEEAESTDACDASSAPAAAPAPSAAPATIEEHCSYTFGDDHVFRLHLATDFETGHIIAAALDEAHDRIFQGGQLNVDLVDAIRVLSGASLDGIADAKRRDRFKIHLYTDVHARATDTRGQVLPDAIRRHVTCDGIVSPVLVENGIPVSVGRSQHIVPDRTRSVITRRDHAMCRVPGCTTTIGLEVHHIIHWEHGGVTDSWNLVLICGHHHRQHHRGRLGILGNADLPADATGALVFTDAHSRRIEPSGASPIPPTGPPPRPERMYQHPLGERLDRSCLTFDPPIATH